MYSSEIARDCCEGVWNTVGILLDHYDGFASRVAKQERAVSNSRTRPNAHWRTIIVDREKYGRKVTETALQYNDRGERWGCCDAEDHS